MACRFRRPSSEYLAYTIRLTVRDLARFGRLYLNRGAWSDARISPADWVDPSTKAVVSRRPRPRLRILVVGLAHRGVGASRHCRAPT